MVRPWENLISRIPSESTQPALRRLIKAGHLLMSLLTFWPWGAYCHAGVADSAPSTVTIKYRGIRPTDPGGRDGLRNPERGFRTETLIGEQTGRTDGVWGIPAHLWQRVGPGYSDQNWLADIRRFSADGVTLQQAYCYLTEFHDRPISQMKLGLLQRSFDAMRAAGVKCVLRFAYIKDYPAKPDPPDAGRILQHMDQLAPLLKRNADVIHTIEAGFIAAWGEWHYGSHIQDAAQRAILLKKILEITPLSIFVQVRYPGAKTELIPTITSSKYKESTSDTAFTLTPEARIGYHDDGVLTYPKGLDGYVFAREPNQFGDLRNLVKRETNFVPMGGELFWSDQAWYGSGVYTKTFDGLEAACYFRDYHFNIMSIAHSYSEREGKPMSIDRWRTQRITQDDLSKNSLPVSRDWFSDFEGKQVDRTVFDYIRDHLGYRLELQEATFTRQLRAGAKLSAEIGLVNRGFSTLFHSRPAVFVLIDGDGQLTELPQAGVDVRRWFPHNPNDPQHRSLTHKFQYVARLPVSLRPGPYSLGLWMPDPSAKLRKRADYAIRFANGDVPFWTSPDQRYWGVNILGVVIVEK